jgi:hypothetical protein
MLPQAYAGAGADGGGQPASGGGPPAAVRPRAPSRGAPAAAAAAAGRRGCSGCRWRRRLCGACGGAAGGPCMRPGRRRRPATQPASASASRRAGAVLPAGGVSPLGPRCYGKHARRFPIQLSCRLARAFCVLQCMREVVCRALAGTCAVLRLRDAHQVYQAFLGRRRRRRTQGEGEEGRARARRRRGRQRWRGGGGGGGGACSCQGIILPDHPYRSQPPVKLQVGSYDGLVMALPGAQTVWRRSHCRARTARQRRVQGTALASAVAAHLCPRRPARCPSPLHPCAPCPRVHVAHLPT